LKGELKVGVAKQTGLALDSNDTFSNAFLNTSSIHCVVQKIYIFLKLNCITLIKIVKRKRL